MLDVYSKLLCFCFVKQWDSKTPLEDIFCLCFTCNENLHIFIVLYGDGDHYDTTIDVNCGETAYFNNN